MLIIGESLNASIPSVKEAIVCRDEEKVKALAVHQVNYGAQMLDLNAGVPGLDESENLTWMVETVQSVTDRPLVLDSADPTAIEAALKVYKGSTPILSSITGEMTEGHERLLTLAVDNNCSLVGMCMDKFGIPADAEGRLVIGRRLFEWATAAGMKPENLYLDPLVMAIATDFNAGMIFLDLLKMIREQIPETRTFCGASNISYGMPMRRLINRTFVAMQAAHGMDAFLVDVRDPQLMATITAAKALTGQDEWGTQYLHMYRSGRLSG